MSESYIGQIAIFGFNFAPKNWAMCNGQLLSIAQNTALFSILGTTYGGNGQTTFGLPDLRSRVPVQFGNGPGLPPVNLGQTGGEENHTLTTQEIPLHLHAAAATTGTANVGPATGNAWCTESSNAYTTNAPDGQMHPTAVANAGSGQPHNNLQPYLTVNFCICLFGIFPSRN